MNAARPSLLLRSAVLIGRLVLGAVFIVAAGPKIMDPPGFAHMIANLLAWNAIPQPLAGVASPFRAPGP